jgi:hypothetical protein
VKAKHKVPHPYSGADDNAPSLNGVRDDERFIEPNSISGAFINRNLDHID